jgi:hypothetical protein
VSRDVIEEQGGVTLYVFALNDSVTKTDYLGKWASGVYRSHPVHQHAVDVALPNLSTKDRQILRDGVKEADNDYYQTTEMSYRHAMHAVTETIEKSKSRANCFVRGQIKQAQEKQKNNGHRAALRYLAFAMHCLQDNTSPMHYNFQDWDEHFSLRRKIAHGEGENYFPSAGHKLYTVTKDAWDYFTGAKPIPETFF